MIKAVLFDIDGTLLDSVDLHAESWVRTFAHFGIAAKFQEVRNHIGEGADRLLPVFLPKGTSIARQKEIEQYRSHLFKTDFLRRLSAIAWALPRMPPMRRNMHPLCVFDLIEGSGLALLWQIFAADERDGIPKSVFQ